MIQNKDPLKVRVALLLSEKFERPVEVDTMVTVEGGCINECYALTTTIGKFFLKKNEANKFPGMFESEAKGLVLLNNAVPDIAPNVITKSAGKDDILIILDWIESGKPTKDFWNQFAQKLSTLHHQTYQRFGLDHDNYIGSLRQSNTWENDWNSFFILHRIEPQLKKSIDERKLSIEIRSSFEKLFKKLSDIFPPAEPSLLHGDLWSGNFMTAVDGSAQLIDPAVYYGHREMDIAMTKLFGGFDHSFYRHYDEYYPMEQDFEQRMQVHQLYPLLVHVNLFGGHFAMEVAAIIKKFT